MAVDFPKRVMHGGTGKLQREKTRKNVLDFSASVNPFPPRFAWHVDPSDLEYYPDDSYTELKDRIAKVFSRDPAEICVGNGSIEIIRAFCAVTLGHNTVPRRYYFEQPTFGEYDLSARLAGATMAPSPDTADVVFVCNPNNPTGALKKKGYLLGTLTSVDGHGGILFVDEAFIGLADPGESLAGVRHPGLFVLHSLTKTFSVPGLRIGFGFGDPSLVETIETARAPWCVNAYAEAFALQALLHLDDLAESRAAIERERDRLAAALTGFGLTPIPSRANYILVECRRNVAGLCDALARKDILVRDCTSFGLPTCIRIAVRTPEENSQLLEALAACVR
ncbi:MAG: pyridoxal phosphate-dependent class II aminotransferase [Methanomicrobiales archaeon]|nr:pyridoxal phosphate-dependent class II aminotransferase [Methanomicrobiales archaeon]